VQELKKNQMTPEGKMEFDSHVEGLGTFPKMGLSITKLWDTNGPE
jgi:hypothetical protein